MVGDPRFELGLPESDSGVLPIRRESPTDNELRLLLLLLASGKGAQIVGVVGGSERHGFGLYQYPARVNIKYS